jgi:hypothetical protein
MQKVMKSHTCMLLDSGYFRCGSYALGRKFVQPGLAVLTSLLPWQIPYFFYFLIISWGDL